MVAIKTAGLKIPILPPNSPGAEQPKGIKLPLHPHQLRALHRCLVLESNGSLSGDFQHRYDYKSRGGVLADTVGMGKTATAIGMVLSGQKGNGGDTLVVAPGHLIPQWKEEIHKFSDDIEVIVGKEEYEIKSSFGNTANSAGKKHRIVLVSVDDILQEEKLWYDFRRVFTCKKGREKKVSRQLMEDYKKSALFCVQSPKGPCSYEGWVYTGKLHIPPRTRRPWRRVIFDEIQDLVAEGTESQKNLLQLSRTAQNVWLLSATPFPHGNQSVYANHELLGFCRLRMDVEVDYPLHHNHTFEVIKRKLYIRSPKDIADQAVTAAKIVQMTTEPVHPSALEQKFYKLEMDENEDRKDIFGESYDSLRQMMVHPEASEKLREQIHGPSKEKGGQASTARGQQVGRYSTVQSFAKSSLNQSKMRLMRLLKSLPAAQKQLDNTRVSEMLARKVRQIRSAPIQSNPFGNNDGTSTLVTPSAADVEAKAIHEYYCRCPALGSPQCKSDKTATFRNRNPGPFQCEFISGKKSTKKIIDYFQTEIAKDVLVPHLGAEISVLDQYIQVIERTYKMRAKAILDLQVEIDTLRKRVEALSSTISTASTTKGGSDVTVEEKLAAKHGSKTAALIHHLRKIQEKGERAIVFSYWHDTLTLVHRSLEKCNLKPSICNGNSGKMSKAIDDFTSGATSILLLSSQAKASGANLQCASHVILLDPVGSSSEHGATLEKQAIGRAVRMGQDKAVTVTRFCVQGTVEEELFQNIDAASAKLEKRSNDSTYMCEDALQELKCLPDPEEEEDDVIVTDSITASDRIARVIAEAEKQGQVIEIDEHGDDDVVSNNISTPAVSPVSNLNKALGNIVKKEIIIPQVKREIRAPSYHQKSHVEVIEIIDDTDDEGEVCKNASSSPATVVPIPNNIKPIPNANNGAIALTSIIDVKNNPNTDLHDIEESKESKKRPTVAEGTNQPEKKVKCIETPN